MTDPREPNVMPAHEARDADILAGEKIDRAVLRAFADAIRRHREGNVPMAIWEDEQVKLVSPFDIPLPEDVNEPLGSNGGGTDE